ncbi:hypothetical protein [Terrihabitans sp. B22-R8]|uniref:hypothetical protein n=1 Tax=Terrihabitans sp. B22-R8 TaxID=3425128 RepID=UPI00403D3524
MRMRYAAAALTLMASLAPAHAAPGDWTNFTSRQYGVRIAYPTHLVDEAKSRPEQGEYTLKDNAQLILSLDELKGQDLRRFLTANLLNGVKVTYAQRKDDWMAYSGYVGDDIVYGRTHVSCEGRFAHTFLIRYPRSERATYDRAVVRLSRTMAVDPVFKKRRC